MTNQREDKDLQIPTLPRAERIHVGRKVVRERKQRINDPLLRVLWRVLALLVVGSLLTATVALLNGTIDLSDTPKTLTARRALELQQRMGQSDDDDIPSIWQQYIVALVVDNQMREARAQMDKYRRAAADTETFVQDRGDYLSFLEAIFAREDGKTDEAIRYFETARDKTWELYQAKLEEGEDMNWAASGGPDSVYEKSLASLMNLYEQQGEDEKLLTTLDAYIELAPNDADGYVRRGDVKVKLKDSEGAVADYKKAQAFLPDDTELADKLNKLGAAPTSGQSEESK
ncbi:MAG: hypothetical protein LBJ07_04600 [Actinomycetes bacterium]|jgi:tetratricopeptide (TPR) repeat protein|nr:hypothetical protein [Actinomycetes bacterium]